MNKTNAMLLGLAVSGLLCAGCATPPAPKPIAYLAVTRPDSAIKTAVGTPAKKEFPRGGVYIGNYNFRPAPDVASYLKQTSEAAGTDIFRNADVQLAVPFYIDLFFCGYGIGKDTVTSSSK